MNRPELLITLIPLLPLAAFLINGLAGRWLRGLGGWIAVLAMAGSAAISVYLAVAIWQGNATFDLPIQVTFWEWLAVGSLQISFGFHFDELTAIMCFVVTFVGSLVFLYSIGYMHGDAGFNRYFSFLSLFAFSMLILVLADSLPLLFFGWEGVGLCSYLLIGYYMDMPGAPAAGKKAFIVNRIGDFGFLVAMFMIFRYCGTLNIAEVLESATDTFSYAGAAVTAITLFLLLGCTGKSAQIPLFVWLPDAMAGPTPVSALIHAATMVTAGVYLVTRMATLFALAPETMVTMAMIGAATAFVAGTIALTQRDIKKVLAYSTISQLGFMFMACGVGAFTAGIFHVMTHAFFKGCLFLGAGAVIHAAGGTQDLFSLGGLRKRLPVTWLTFLIACLAISGFPLTAGFFSKDEILWKTAAFSPLDLRLGGFPLLWFVGSVTALLTAAYSFRMLFLTFHGETRLPESVRSHLHPPGWTMKLPLIVLAAGALAVGFLNVPHGWGGDARFETFLEPVIRQSHEILVENVPQVAAEHSVALEIALTVFSSIIALLGIGLAMRYTLRRWPQASESLAGRFGLLYRMSYAAWWWDLCYNVIIGGGIRLLGRFAVWIDDKLIDGVLHALVKIAREGSRTIRRAQSGQVQAYALIMLIGANILLLMILIW